MNLSHPLPYRSRVKKIKDRFSSFIRNVKIQTVNTHLKRKGFEVYKMGQDGNILSVNLGEPVFTLLSMDVPTKSLLMESTLILDSSILNLKTFSIIAHTCSEHGLSISGIVPDDNETVKFYVSKVMNMPSALSYLPRELGQMKSCVLQIIQYISYKSGQTELVNLDLSMFENIDMSGVSLQEFGEKKEFVYFTWDKYRDSILGSSKKASSVVNDVEKINACALFEERNNLNLSEIGDLVLEELIWNKEFVSLSEKEDEYYIN